MTNTPHAAIAAGHARDREAALIEPAATALAAADGVACFDPYLPDVPERAAARDRYRRRAGLALEAAGAFQLARVLRQAKVMDRISSRHALAAERDVADIAATLANRDAEIARLNAREAGRQVKLHDACTEQARLIAELKLVREAAHRRVLGMNAERSQWQDEWAHLRDLIGKYGDDGMISVVTIRNALRDGPPRRPRAGDRMVDGGMPGVLVTCRECSGDGLLHQSDEPPAPGPAPQDEPAGADR